MDIYKIPREMQLIMYKAFACYEGNDLRGFADFMLKSALAAPRPWTYGRYYCWGAYIDTLNKNVPLVNESDKVAFQEILANDEEPALYRGMAALCLGSPLFGYDANREENVDYCRQAVEIFQNMPASDADRTIFTAPHGRATTIREQASIVLKVAKYNIRCHMDPIGSLSDPAREDIMKSGQYGTFTHQLPNREMSPELKKLLEMGGGACDCCGKTLEELGVVRLLCCSVCKSSYYCGRDCQRKQWKAGHRDACRKPGEIKSQDLMRIRGFKSRPELNEDVVLALRLDPEDSDHWIVRTFRDQTLISVATSNLFHLRPAK